MLSIVAGATGRPPDSAVLLASEAPALVLNLRFTSTDSLPIASRRSLMAEAESTSTENLGVRRVDRRRADASQRHSGDRDRINDWREANRR